MDGFVDLLRGYQAHAETALDRWLPGADSPPQRLHEAMRYACLGGGKRVRPLLVYLTGVCLGVPRPALDGLGAAVELIHAYSLVHDDLPAMDNDDLRRGRPTCHRAYDEATAILVGDALQALAFEIIALDDRIEVDATRRVQMLATLAQGAGSLGMAGGQALDLAAIGTHLTLAELETMHSCKTGALIRSAVRLGVLSAPTVDPAIAQAFDRYARAIGLAFQVQDDILDVEGETEVIGKPQGSDIARNKPTYPNLLGLKGARQAAAALQAEALDAVAGLGGAADPLRALAHYIVLRDR
jgi:farnesyl diphosphate synthase